ncbi:MAG: hypothetical protein EBR88_00045 [Betaproteobacteria bacterium]|nr:hypothetical protein [Betaproteobacteria bacterium]
MARFYFHYNKPASRREGRPMLTVHSQGCCHLVHHIECSVPVYTRVRKTQPHVVMAGTGTIWLAGGTCRIT